MKKIITMIVALVATVSAFAQQEEGTLSVAPKAGINLANCTNSDGDMKVGLVAGVDLTYQVSEKFAVSGGLFYSQQGTQASEEGITAKLNFDYFNVPILANYYVIPGLAIKAGIQPGALLSSKFKLDGGGESAEKDTKHHANSMDLSIPVGVSYEYKNFIVDARYNIGVTQIQKEGESNHYTADEKSRNSVIMLTVGYKFCL